jgi:hypothetical protein
LKIGFRILLVVAQTRGRDGGYLPQTNCFLIYGSRLYIIAIRKILESLAGGIHELVF